MTRDKRKAGDEGDDFEIPDIDIPGAGDVVKEGIKNRRTRPYFLAAIAIGIIILLAYLHSKENEQRSTPSQFKRYTDSYTREVSPRGSYKLVGSVTGTESSLNLVYCELFDGAVIEVGQTVFVAERFAHPNTIRLTATVGAIDNSRASLQPDFALRYYTTGMAVYSREPE